MTLLQNASAAIKLAIADFNSKDPERLLSCLRNLHAGILLLFKEKLLRLSPAGSDEVLLKQKILPSMNAAGELGFRGVGRKTVDVAEIKERFKSLLIATDWVRFDRVNGLRNDVEHYYSTVSDSAIRGAVSDTFIVIRDFITRELKEDSLAVLGKETWDEMLKLSEVLEAERKACAIKIGSMEWNSATLERGARNLECDKCGSPLLRAENGPKEPSLACVSCGHSRIFEDYVEEAISSECDLDNYMAAKDGCEPASIACPFCFKETYVVGENKCACCGERCEHTCARCGNEIPVSELSDGSYCSWCEHMTSKDD